MNQGMVAGAAMMMVAVTAIVGGIARFAFRLWRLGRT